MLVEHALEPLIGWDGFELTRKVLVFFLRRGGDEAVAEIGAPLQETTPAPCIAALLGRGTPAAMSRRMTICAASPSWEPPLTRRSITAATRARSSRSADGAYAGLRRSPLALAPWAGEARLKIDERLQILL